MIMKKRLFTLLAIGLVATTSMFAQLELKTDARTVTSQVYLQFEGDEIVPTDVTGVTNIDGTDSVYILTTKTTVAQEANKIVADGEENVLWMDYDGSLKIDSTILNKEHFSFSCDMKWSGDNNVWYMGLFGFTGLNMDRTVVSEEGDTVVTPGYAAKQFQMANPTAKLLKGLGITTTKTFPAIDTWAHLVFTYDTGDVKVYIDDVFAGESSAQILHTYNHVELYLGIKATVDVTTGVVKGGIDGNGNCKETLLSIDNVALFDVALTAEEVSQVYAASKGETAGLQNNKLETLSAYPNPVSDVLYLQDNNVASVAIYSLTGKMVQRSTVSNASVDMSQLASGLYFLKALDSNQEAIASLKVMKR